MATKWEIMITRLNEAKAEVERRRADIMALIKTPLHNTQCSGCGKPLQTEAEFAQHFEVSNPQYLNLGYCPDNPPA